MIKCQFCQALQVDNTIFCNECGHYLLGDKGGKTDPLGTIDMNWIKAITDDIEVVSPSPQEGKSLAIRLKIGSTRREVEMPLDIVIHIGRIDATANIFPELDLSNDIDHSYGVSRRHARIMKQGDTVIIEDMGSINGTFINGRRLDPYCPEVIKNGDILHLGKLRLEAKIKKQ